MDSVNDEDLEMKDDRGNNVLHYAYAFGQVSVLEIFFGASFHSYFCFKKAKTTTIIEEHSKYCEVENNDGKTPLEVTGTKKAIFPKGFSSFLARNTSWKLQLEKKDAESENKHRRR